MCYLHLQCTCTHTLLVLLAWTCSGVWFARLNTTTPQACVTSSNSEDPLLFKQFGLRISWAESVLPLPAHSVFKYSRIVRKKEMQVRREEEGCAVIHEGLAEVQHLLYTFFSSRFYIFKACTQTLPRFFFLHLVSNQKTSLLHPLAKSSRRTQMTSWSLFAAPSTAHCFKGASFIVGVAQRDRETPQEVKESTEPESSPCLSPSTPSSRIALPVSTRPFRLQLLIPPHCRSSPSIFPSRSAGSADAARTDLQYSSSSLRMSVSFTCPTPMPSPWSS